MLRSVKKTLPRNEQGDETTYLANLAVQRNASAFFDKFDRSELQELLTTTSCSWLASKDDLRQPLELPSGLMGQLKNISFPNAIFLAPVVPDVPLDCKEVHQIVRELAVGIYCLNQIPSISLDSNYDHSTSCQLPPAYIDTRIGQILISVDYMLKALWHGVYMPKEKRVRFSELWRSSMDIDMDGNPQTEKNIFSEFCSAGLVDLSNEPGFEGIYDENMNEDPTYDPNSAQEKNLFMQYADNILFKLTFGTIQVQQHESVCKFDAAYVLSNVIRLTEDHLDTVTYQRLQQRLILQQKLVKKHLEKKAEIRKNIEYLKIVSFLIPFLLGLKRKMKIPNLNQLLQPYSDDKVKTERELPPFVFGPDFKCQHFHYIKNEYFHVHGGIEFDVGTPSLEDVSEEIKAVFDDIQICASNHVAQLLDPDIPYREHYSIPTMEFDGKRYYVISIELETFYQQLYKTPWWGAINEIISTLKPKRLPLTDIQSLEQFKKRFGYKKAIKCKSLPYGMKSAAERGLSAIFHTFCRKTSTSSLGVVDEYGYALLHHASIHNRVPIICQLIKAHLNINQRRNVHFNPGRRSQKSETKGDRAGKPDLQEKETSGERTALGPTALHLAAQCGSIEALTCLLAFKADYKLTDDRGWMAIHFAAFYDNISCITVLYRKDPDLLEAETTAEYHSTPLLLAATSGALDTLQYLFSLGANWKKTDSEGNNIIHLAVLYFHTEILKHLIQLDNPDLPVWNTLVEMLQCEDSMRPEMAVRSLEVLCLAKDFYWKCILDSGAIPSLINLLKGHQIKLACITSGVLSNISPHITISKALIEAGGISVLIELLGSGEPELQSRCAVILYDIAQFDNNQNVITELGGIPPLINLLKIRLQDLLVNVINCIRVLCIQNKQNQITVKEHQGIPALVEFLTSQSDVLQAVSSAALAELARGNEKMQDAIADADAIGPLVELLRGRKITVQVKGAMAIEALSDNNTHIQRLFLEKSATKYLLKLLKAFHLTVKEQGATTLWALAGQTLKQQKLMAEQIGYNFIIDMLLSPSDKMQYVGGEAVIALSKDSKLHQNQICEGNGIGPLVRLLRSTKIAEGTLLSVIRALGTICIGVAHTNNPVSQENIVDEQALPILVHLLKNHNSLQIKVEVAYSLACIVLRNSNLQTVLQEEEGFNYSDVLELLNTPDKDICLRAGYALALFAYNNPVQQFLILETGAVMMSTFEPFLRSEIETDKAMAAFQIVVLARVIVDVDQVTLSARGVTILVELLNSEKIATLVLTGKLLASLAHTRAGVPEAITELGTIKRLCYHLYSDKEEVRIASAGALGYLTFNRTAYRHLLVECRNKPKQFTRLMNNLSRDAKICQDFVKEFQRQRQVGLPSLSLVINGGPPAVPTYTKERSRSSSSRRQFKAKFHPKDSLLLMPISAHLMGKLRTTDKPRSRTTGLHSFAHATSDITKVSRPRIFNVSKIGLNSPGKKA
ncbi:ankyrin and armadillo repeat-containing protein [Gopherus flavomarginatus]|uniref:ankyrin and armadillo repeat-containing protein n=1 Tax=Gopherus flavomarginatus TaxID=286002 RepID=UPI0021CC29ED|nr:ankyrin and armadillo repeat-containing protein [Gopherus flavomarginatus]